MFLKSFFVLFFFYCNSTVAQIIPSQVLNNTKTFEVTACKPSKNKIISVWMEKRAIRKDNDPNAADMQVGYKLSKNNGKDWTEKLIIDLPNTFGTGNPYVTCNEKGEAYLVCMHIGKDFWSGNLSLYEFDFDKEKFNLKSVPFKSDDKLLDKPSIVSFGNEIHLVYVAYSKHSRNSVKYQMSNDKGKTWTDPVSVFSDSISGYLGPSIAVLKGNQIVVSTGAYGRKDISIAKKKNYLDSIMFERPIIITKVSNSLGAAMTELSSDENKLILTWQNPHQRNETWMSLSNDEGATWTAPHLITAKGNLLSAVFDENGNINCIYSDFDNQQYYVGYKLLDPKFKILKERKLMGPTPLLKFDEYLGAYQKILIQDNNIFAFWIDYPNNSTLHFSKWKM